MTKVHLKAQWPSVKLGSFVDLVSGFPFKSKLFTNKTEDVHLVKGENLHQGYIDWNNAKRWKASEFPQYERFQLNPGDVVLAMDRPWIEAGLKFSWIKKHDPKALLVQRVARMRGTNGLSTSYLRYVIASSQFTDYIKPIVTGVNVPHISGQQIKDFEFLLPPYDIQRRIAEILSAYDDLIENNTRRIQILEEMARRIYEEWFVRFRFPGHENVRMVESELGLIPAGWEVKRLGDISNIQWGDTTKTKKEYVDAGYDAFSASGLDGKLPYYDFDHDGIVLSAIGAQCGLTWFARGKWSCIKNTIRYWALDTEISNEYLFWSTHGQGFWTRRGAAQPFISLGDARSSRILKPTKNLLERYKSIAMPAMRQVNILRRKNLNLRHTRDLLLPKLISGEIDVSHFPEPCE